MTTTELVPDVDITSDPAFAEVSAPAMDAAVTAPVLPTSAEEVKDFKLLHVDPDELVIGRNARAFDVDDLDTDFVADLGERGNYVPVIARFDEQGQLVVRDGQVRTHGLRAAKRLVFEDAVGRAVQEAQDLATERSEPFTAEDGERVAAQVREYLTSGAGRTLWNKALVLAQMHDITDVRAAEIERLVEQHGANFLRFAMKETDHLRTVQGLLELGVTPEEVGTKLRLKPKDATMLVAVARSTHAAELAQQGVLGVAESSIIAEFEEYGDEPEAVEALTDVAQTQPHQLANVAQRLRHARIERLAVEAATAELTGQGVTVIERPDTTRGPKIRQLADLRPSSRTKPGRALTVKRHASCPGHAAYVTFTRTWEHRDGKINIIHVCTDFQKHGHAELNAEPGKALVERPTYSTGESGSRKGPMTEQEKAYRRTVIANGKAWDAAEIKRLETLELFARRQSLPQTEDSWLEAMRVSSDRYADSGGHSPLALKLLGWENKFTGYGDDRKQQIMAEILKAKPQRARVIGMVFVLAALEKGLSRRTTWERPNWQDVAYFTKLQELGLRTMENGQLVDWVPSEVEQLVFGPTAPVDAALGAAVEDEVDVEAVQDDGLAEDETDADGVDSEAGAPAEDVPGTEEADDAPVEQGEVVASVTPIDTDGPSGEVDLQVDLAA